VRRFIPDNTNANTTIYNLEPFSTYYGKGTNLNITKYCNTSKKLNKVKNIRNYHLNIVIQLMVLILFLRKPISYKRIWRNFYNVE
jgi:hypothetical protein